MRRERFGPVDFYHREVLPRLTVETVYGTVPFRSRHGRRWRGPCPLHGGDRPDAFVVDTETLRWTCFSNCGHGDVLDYLNGGPSADGPDFVELVKRAAALAGVDASVLEGELSPADAARRRGRDLLETFLDVAREALDADPDAQTYLRDRGFTEADLAALPVGLCPPFADLTARLEAAGFTRNEVEAANLTLDRRWPGRIVLPWRDRWGRLATVAARDRTGTATDADKYLRLKDHDTPPFFGLDVALRQRTGRADLVVVEGLFDVLLLQARGFPNVVAVGGRGDALTARWGALVDAKVRTVTLALDNDTAGRDGLTKALDGLRGVQAAPAVFVVNPTNLEAAKDPDEYVRTHGLDAFRALVAHRVPAAVYRANVIIGNVTPDSPVADRRRVVDEVLAFADTLRDRDAGLDREDVLTLLQKRTGYDTGTLADRAESLATLRRKEESEKALAAALRHAQDTGDRTALDVARDLTAELAVLQARTVDPPPPFDVDRLDAETRADPEGLSSGWAALDRLEVCFNAGELAVLGARTGHAKTTALVGLLRNWLRTDGDALFVFYSSEERVVRVYHRLLALLTAEAESGWTANEARDYLRNPAGRDSWRSNPNALTAARETLRALQNRLLVVHRPSWSVADITAHALALAERGPVGAVLVDYLQRIPPPTGSHERRDIELSAAARALRTLALSAAVPVVVSAQISREAVRGNDVAAGNYRDKKVQDSIRARRPQLHHLREGGSEQEADLVLGLLNYRADYEQDEEDAEAVPHVTRLEVGVLKSRYAASGHWVGLAFESPFGWVRDEKWTGEV